MGGVKTKLLRAKTAWEDLQDLQTIAPADRDRVGQAMIDSARSLKDIAYCVDEYLVFIAEKKFFPLTFDVCSVVEPATYKEIQWAHEREAMAIKVDAQPTVVTQTAIEDKQNDEASPSEEREADCSEAESQRSST